MRNYLKYLVFGFLFGACNQPHGLTWKEVVQADSIELIQQYMLENPESEHLMEGRRMLRRYWAKYLKNEPFPFHHCKGCIQVGLTKGNRLIFPRWDTLGKALFLERFIDAIINPRQEPWFGEWRYQTVGQDSFRFVRNYVMINSEEGVSQENYEDFLKLIDEGVFKARDSISRQWFNTPFNNLKDDRRKAISEFIPRHFFIEGTPWFFDPPPPPPPIPDSIYSIYY